MKTKDRRILIQLQPEQRSNARHPFPFVVQVYCSGAGFCDSLHGGTTLAAAHAVALQLANEDGRWCSPEAPRYLRIVRALHHEQA